MANLPELDEFTAGVYQWEVTDPNEAGPDGVMNVPLKALTNRTLWLKNQLAFLDAVVTGLSNVLTSVANRVTNLEAFNTTTKFVLFYRKATFVLGDILAGANTYNVSFTAVPSANYMVVGSIVNPNTAGGATVVWSVSDKTTTSFKITVSETAVVVQNVSFDYMLIPLS